MNGPLNVSRVFYVYVLFDHEGIPRYVGKGRGNRWDDHGRKKTRNRFLNKFIVDTLAALGEIPKVKVRSDLTETDAFEIEAALISAIGRADLRTGPLANLTNGGEGLKGHIFSAATRALISKNKTEWMALFSAEERSAMARHAATSGTPEERSEIARIRWERRSREERHAILRKSNNAGTPEERSERARLRWASRSPEERSSILRKSSAGRTPEQRIALARKAALAQTFEHRSAAGKRSNINMTVERRLVRAAKGWATRRARAALPQESSSPPPD